jgi:hypothetical protein
MVAAEKDSLFSGSKNRRQSGSVLIGLHISGIDRIGAFPPNFRRDLLGEVPILNVFLRELRWQLPFDTAISGLETVGVTGVYLQCS